VRVVLCRVTARRRKERKVCAQGGGRKERFVRNNSFYRSSYLPLLHTHLRNVFLHQAENYLSGYTPVAGLITAERGEVMG